MNTVANYSSLTLSLCAVGGGLIMLVSGGEFLVSGATRLARHFGMSTLLIGLTVIAFGTSIPELFVSLTATLQGHQDIMIGNVVGSNIANIGLILGISLILAPLFLDFSHILDELLLVLAASLVLIGCAFFQIFPRIIGFVFVVLLVLYTLRAYRKNSNTNNSAGNMPSTQNTPKFSFLIISSLITGGFLLLSFGSHIFINGAVDVARYFNINELIIGLTLAAIGTSLPELASSLAAIRRREGDLLIGNIIGSNLFNLLMVLGLTAIIKPFFLSTQLLHRDLPIMLGFTLTLIPILGPKGPSTRRSGIFLLGSYIGYCLLLL